MDKLGLGDGDAAMNCVELEAELFRVFGDMNV